MDWSLSSSSLQFKSCEYLVIDFLSDGGENTNNIMAHQGKCFSAKISHIGINIEYGNAMTICMANDLPQLWYVEFVVL